MNDAPMYVAPENASDWDNIRVQEQAAVHRILLLLHHLQLVVLTATACVLFMQTKQPSLTFFHEFLLERSFRPYLASGDMQRRYRFVKQCLLASVASRLTNL
jgi:hypothetical protein